MICAGLERFVVRHQVADRCQEFLVPDHVDWQRLVREVPLIDLSLLMNVSVYLFVDIQRLFYFSMSTGDALFARRHSLTFAILTIIITHML